MTQVSFRPLFLLALAGVAALAVAGCGNDVPPGAVAKVGDAEITQDEFDKWITTAAMSQAQGAPAAVPEPPEFAKCVAQKKKAPVPEGQGEQSGAALKKQCKTEYDQLKSEVMQFLIQAEWLKQEAEQQNINLSDKAVAKALEDQKKQAFPTDKAYRQFLKTSGMKEKDILFRVELQELQTKLTQKVTERANKVSDSAIQEYYDKNKKRFAQPERRDLRVVLAKTEAQAEQAKSALDGGQPWADVVKEYSIDEASKAQKGRLPAVAEGQQEKPLDEAVFAANRGAVRGPVKTQFGWYVFEVEKVTPAAQQTLEQSKDTIKNLLRSERQQKALDKFVKDFRKQYKEETQCAEDFRVADCQNAPKGSGRRQGSGAQTQPAPQEPSSTTPEQ